MIKRLQPTHIRYEPDIDSGTTYAFNYRAGQLVIGRRPMWELIQAVESGVSELNELLDTLVTDDTEGMYVDAVSLLADLTRLVDAQVLSMDRSAS